MGVSIKKNASLDQKFHLTNGTEVNLARGIRITEFLKNFASGTILSHSAPFEQNKIIAIVLFEDSHNFI